MNSLLLLFNITCPPGYIYILIHDKINETKIMISILMFYIYCIIFIGFKSWDRNNSFSKQNLKKKLRLFLTQRKFCTPTIYIFFFLKLA